MGAQGEPEAAPSQTQSTRRRSGSDSRSARSAQRERQLREDEALARRLQAEQMSEDEALARQLQLEEEQLAHQQQRPQAEGHQESNQHHQNAWQQRLESLRQQRQEPIATIPELAGLRIVWGPEGVSVVPNHNTSSRGPSTVEDALLALLERSMGGLDVDNMSYEQLLELGGSMGGGARGASRETIDSLPTRSYQSRSAKQSSNSRAEASTTQASSSGGPGASSDQYKCCICMSDYEEGDTIRTLPCLHCYHAGCIDPWLETNRTCPVCKHEVQ
mmetsp:Transcript_22084/g.61303  ORF Transcript_22084/g.61303 Transcript_22084/m.61303 type:complete len:274 (+) Transcript_22084:3-824(+)